MSKLLTVVTATYNKGDRNRASIQSILDQTYRDFEYIIVNDGSPDHTKEIFGEFEDSRLTVIHQENKGFIKTMVSVMSEIETPYVAIQGAGDISLPDRLEKQIKFLESRPEVGVVSSIVRQTFVPRLDLAKETAKAKRANEQNRTQIVEYKEVEQMIQSNIINHGEAMIRMSAYREAGGYHPFFKYAQDRDLWLRILEKYSVVRLNQELYLKVIDSKLDIYGNPRKIEKQTLYSLFARYLARQRINGGEGAANKNLEDSYKRFIETMSDSDKHQILTRLSSRIRSDSSRSKALIDDIDEALEIMETYLPQHSLIRSLKALKFIKKNIPYGNELYYHSQQINEAYRQIKRTVKRVVVAS